MIQQYYYEEHALSKRRKQSAAICLKYPSRVPLIVQPKSRNSTPWLKTCKFLVPETSTTAALLHHIRSMLTVDSTVGLYYVVGTNQNVDKLEKELFEIVTPTALIGNMYKQYVKDDGFCYVYYEEESMFGGGK